MKTKLLFILSFCLVYTPSVVADEHNHAHSEKGGTGAAIHSLTVSHAVQEVMGLQVVKSEMRVVDATVAFPGRFELLPEARQVVASPVEGRLAVQVKSLAQIQKGELLFTVASPELVAQAYQIQVLERRLAVYHEAQTPNAALASELAVLRATRDAALAGATETNGVVSVCAPTEALVEDLLAQDGAWVSRGTSVIQLVQPRRLRFAAQVAAEDVAKLKEGQSATVNGQKGVVRIGVGDASGLVPVYVVFGQDIAAFAGARGVAECVTATPHDSQPAVPTEAIVRIGLQPTVFVRDAHDTTKFLAVPVTPLQQGGGWTAVKGLPAVGCEVVRKGAYELKLGLAAGGEKPAGHFHADGVFHEGEH